MTKLDLFLLLLGPILISLGIWTIVFLPSPWEMKLFVGFLLMLLANRYAKFLIILRWKW